MIDIGSVSAPLDLGLAGICSFHSLFSFFPGEKFYATLDCVTKCSEALVYRVLVFVFGRRGGFIRKGIPELALSFALHGERFGRMTAKMRGRLHCNCL